MYDEYKTLYRRHLESNGFVTTRAADLDKAIKMLHYAICQLDTQQLEVAQKLLKSNVADVINDFGKIEELRKGF